MEFWRSVKGFEGFYEVSNFGNVRTIPHYSNYKGKSKRFIQGRIKKTSLDKDGYSVVALYKGKEKKLRKVHRLVAEAFIENKDNLPQINHKDEQKTNNAASNLEWCDAKYNNNYGTKKVRLSETKKKIGKCFCNSRDKNGRFCKASQLQEEKQ